MSRLEEVAHRVKDSMGGHTEGGLARPMEDITASLPSDTWLYLAYGSILASVTLKILGRDKDATFVGLWAPCFLIHGVYNKLVKQLGHDSQS